MPRRKTLSQKQRRFIDHYLINFNATEAARQAGYSERSASTIGYENLRKPQIAEEIARRVEDLAMGQEEALIRLAAQARSNIAAYLSPNGFNIGPDQDLSQIRKIKRYADGSVEIELYSSQAALKIILDHLNRPGTEENPLHLRHLADDLADGLTGVIADSLAAAREAASAWETPDPIDEEEIDE